MTEFFVLTLGTLLMVWMWQRSQQPLFLIRVGLVFIVLNQFFENGLIPGYQLAGYNIYPNDLLCILMFSRAGSNIINRLDRSFSFLHACLFTSAFLLAVSTYRGLNVAHDPKLMVNQARAVVQWQVALLYFISQIWSEAQITQLVKDFIVTSVALCGVILAKIAMLSAGIPVVMNNDGHTVVPRMIRSAASFFMMGTWLIASVTGALESMKKSTATMFSCLVLFATIVSQHRSVWLAGIVMIVLWVSLSRKAALPRLLQAFGILLVGLVLLAPFVKLDGFADAIMSSFERAADQKDTVQWRYESWQDVLSPSFMGSDANYIIGRPLGSDWGRTIGKTYVTVQAHNNYIQHIANDGVIGLLAEMAVLLFLIVNLFKTRLRELVTIVAASLTYYVSYSAQFELALCLGVLVGVVSCPAFSLNRKLEDEELFDPVRERQKRLSRMA